MPHGLRVVITDPLTKVYGNPDPVLILDSNYYLNPEDLQTRGGSPETAASIGLSGEIIRKKDSLKDEDVGIYPYSVEKLTECSVMSDSLRPHESQHARPPCPSPTPRVHPNLCPSSW